MSNFQQLIVGVQNAAKPVENMGHTLEDRNDRDFNSSGTAVARQLAARGYDPVEKLVDACTDEDSELSLWQKTVLDRELLQYMHPKLRATEITGKGGGPIPLLLATLEDENI